MENVFGIAVEAKTVFRSTCIMNRPVGPIIVCRAGLLFNLQNGLDFRMVAAVGCYMNQVVSRPVKKQGEGTIRIGLDIADRKLL